MGRRRLDDDDDVQILLDDLLTKLIMYIIMLTYGFPFTVVTMHCDTTF